MKKSMFGVFLVVLVAQVFAAFNDFLQRLKRHHQRELIFFSRQMAMLLKSGIPITGALSSIYEQVKNKDYKDVLRDILKDIQAGMPFSGALAKHPQMFSDVYVSMVKAGEASGILDEVLERLTQLNSREYEIKSRIKSAMTYPLILVIVSIIIVNFLLVNIVPKFIVIFQSYQVRLPLATRVLLGISFLFNRLWLVVLITVIGAIFLFRIYLKTEKGRYKFDYWMLHLPIFGELYLNVAVSQMCRTLGAMVKSGVPILEGLFVTSKTIKNLVISRVVENARHAVSQGQPLSQPFKASGVFPATVIQMVTLGEKSSRLDQMLIEVASFYEEEVDYSIKNMTAALEPLLLLAMGGVVAFIALSVLLPIFNLIKVFKH